MNVQSSTRRRALLDIYQAHHKGRGGVLTHKQLERDWKETGLRRSDLELALKSLTEKQFLLPRRTHEGMSYELTYLGECAMQYVMAGGVLVAVRDWVTLHRAKLRRRATGATDHAHHNRREEDHPIVEAPGLHPQK